MPRADYGIDAPTVVRNLGLAGAACTLAGAVTGIHLLLFPGLSWLATGAWMIFGSRVLKLRARDRLLDGLALRGDERVLDVGCGRGLLLIGAAKRLPRGMATGVDLWRTVDQSGNAEATTFANLRAEGVETRAVLHTGDFTRLPFPDASFDAIVSSWAIHNVPTQTGRDAALAECVRVLVPGGRLAILDIGPGRSYGAVLAAAGLVDVVRRIDNVAFLIPTWRITGCKPVDVRAA